MDKRYRAVLQNVAHSVVGIAEQAIEYHSKKNEQEAKEESVFMRDHFREIERHLTDEHYDLTRSDYSLLLVGVYIVIGDFNNRIKAMQQSIGVLTNEIAKKLSDISELKDDEAVTKKAEELFNFTPVNN